MNYFDSSVCLRTALQHDRARLIALHDACDDLQPQPANGRVRNRRSFKGAYHFEDGLKAFVIYAIHQRKI
jgi:hypothetical protein